MAFLSSLMSASEPSGFWITIIKAFEAVTNNYVLAIIFLTVVIRLVWGIVDTLTKFNTQNMSNIQAKMQPEIDKLKAKYASQPQVLQQKQNEIYKKYYGKSYYGSCIVSMVVMALNLLIFFTLFSGLNAMSAYKISSNYDNIKFTYANCLNVANAYWEDENVSLEDKKEILSDYENLNFIIESNEEGEKSVSLVHSRLVGEENVDTVIAKLDYKTDFSEKVPGEGEEETIITTNENIIKLIEKYFPVYEEGEEVGSKEIIIGTKVTTEEGEEVQSPIYLSNALNYAIMNEVVETYDSTQEKFLWIQNIWIADSPLSKSIVSYSTLKGQVGKNHFQKGEEQIYNAFMPQLKQVRNKTNGYFILSILCILVSLLTMYLTKFYNDRKNKKKGLTPAKSGAKWAQIVVPIMLGVFALFYNSVFAIYMLVGQIVSCVLLLPQLLFVDFVTGKIKSKKVKSDNELDYSRKF